MQSLKFQVSLIRLLRCVKAAFSDAFAIYHNLNTPFALMRGNPQKARMIGFGRTAHILQIPKPGDLAKIFKTVVFLVSVFVINVKRWMLSGHIQPRKAMSQSFLVVNGDCPVASVGWTTGTLADKIRATVMYFPNKFARFRVVVKNRSEMVSGNHEFQLTIKAAK